MNETVVTLAGWLGGEVTVRQAGDSIVANFRVATTPRRYQRKSDTWVDGDTQWYSVCAWRGLAENCQRSLRRGDPVVVHGKLKAQVWTNSAGIEVTSFEVEASFVGHDLNRGTSEFSRNVRALTDPSAPAEPGEPGEPGDPATAEDVAAAASAA